MIVRQCSSCGGFCKKSGCERANVVEPELTPAELRAGIALQLREIERLRAETDDQQKVIAAYEMCNPPWAQELRERVKVLEDALRDISQFDLWEPAGPASNRARAALEATKP